MRKNVIISILFLLLFVLTGCSAERKIIELGFSSIIVNDYDLVKYSDNIIRFEVLDDLTKENSTIKYSSDIQGGIAELYSKRKVFVYNSTIENMVGRETEIYTNEAVSNKYHYKLEGTKSLEKGGIYYGFLIYSEHLNEFKVIASESSIIYDDFEFNDYEDASAEFYAVINLNPEVFSDENEGRESKIWDSPGFKDFFNYWKRKIFIVDGKEIILDMGFLDASNTEIIEYKGHQFQIYGKFIKD